MSLINRFSRDKKQTLAHYGTLTVEGEIHNHIGITVNLLYFLRNLYKYVGSVGNKGTTYNSVLTYVVGINVLWVEVDFYESDTAASEKDFAKLYSFIRKQRAASEVETPLTNCGSSYTVGLGPWWDLQKR